MRKKEQFEIVLSFVFANVANVETSDLFRRKLWLFYTYNGFHGCCVLRETSGTVGCGRRGGIGYIGLQQATLPGGRTTGILMWQDQLLYSFGWNPV